MRRPTDTTGARTRSSRALSIVCDLGFLGVFAVAAAFLWPVSLGGSSQVIVVQGHSMEPTHSLGDLLLVRSNPSPDTGDVILFRIPDDEPGGGSLVIHRLVDQRSDGSYVTQGDNRATADPFHLEPTDIVGSPVVAVPRAGRLIGLASRPWVVGMVAGLMVTLLLWPTRRDGSDDVVLDSVPARV